MPTTLLRLLPSLSLYFMILAVTAAPPKVILNIIVDDLGWSNFGPRSPNPPENETPRLTSLASRGVTLLRQYNHFTCTPSRSSFTTGRLPVHVQTTLDNPDKINAGIPINMTSIAERMQRLGYVTAIYGKWDQGGASPRHTPEGRGYDHSFIYFEHMNNYWNWTIEPTGTACNNAATPLLIDAWENGAPANISSSSQSQLPQPPPIYWDEAVFSRALAAIANSSSSSDGLYLDVRPHSMHWPLMVDQETLLNFSWVGNDESSCSARFYQNQPIFPGGGTGAAGNFSCRRQYQAMLHNLDKRIGSLEDALIAAGLWNQTLITFFSDNGGVIDISESAGNNYPHRGGKYTPLEGGIRVTAFWGGGYLPASSYGTSIHGIVSVADYSTTLCIIGGGTLESCQLDTVAEAAGLPPLDSLNVWPLISGINLTSPRVEIPVSNNVLIQYKGVGNGSGGGPIWKWLSGTISRAAWTGPIFPNATGADPAGVQLDCGVVGCLFDIWADPEERNDVALTYPSIASQMKSRLNQLSNGFYSNSDEGGTSRCPKNTPDCMCWAGMNLHGGFLGPFHDWP